MALPKIALPTDSIEVGGEVVTFRSLSRSEAIRVSTEYQNRPDEAENFILACGTGVTEAAATKWRSETDPEQAGRLIDAIIFLSGLADRPVEGDEDPKGS